MKLLISLRSLSVCSGRTDWHLTSNFMSFRGPSSFHPHPFSACYWVIKSGIEINLVHTPCAQVAVPAHHRLSWYSPAVGLGWLASVQRLAFHTDPALAAVCLATCALPQARRARLSAHPAQRWGSRSIFSQICEIVTFLVVPSGCAGGEVMVQRQGC